MRERERKRDWERVWCYVMVMSNRQLWEWDNQLCRKPHELGCERDREREWAWVAFLWPSRSVFFNLVTIFKWKMRLWETKRDELVIAIAIAIDLVIELSFRLYLFHFITLMGFEPICKSSSLYDIYIYYTCVGVWMCSSVNIQFKKENC